MKTINILIFIMVLFSCKSNEKSINPELYAVSMIMPTDVTTWPVYTLTFKNLKKTKIDSLRIFEKDQFYSNLILDVRTSNSFTNISFLKGQIGGSHCDSLEKLFIGKIVGNKIKIFYSNKEVDSLSLTRKPIFYCQKAPEDSIIIPDFLK